MPLSVLIVDDNEDDRFLARRALTKSGKFDRIDTAVDGHEALARLGLEPPPPDALLHAPGLILLDINMPRVNGFEFLERYTRMRPDAVVVILTSSLDLDDRARAKTFACVRGYIEKPLTRTRAAELANQLAGSA